MEQGTIRPQWSLVQGVYRLADLVAICGALAIVLAAAGWPAFPPQVTLAGVVAVLAFYLVGEVTGQYRSWRAATIEAELCCTLGTWAATIPPLLAVGFFTRATDFWPRSLLLSWMFAAPALQALLRVLMRWTLRWLRARGYNTRRYAIAGINTLGFQLASSIDASDELGLQRIGFFDDRPPERTPRLPDEFGNRLGDLDDLVAAARDRRIDLIYITFPMRAEQRIQDVLERLGDTTASVYIVPDFFVFQLLHSQWTTIGGLPAVSVFESPLYGIDGLAKRAFDLVISLTLLAMLALPMLILSILIAFTSPGPVFFRQRRYGLNGEEILVWKFRTMTVCEDGPQVKQATRNDARVTPLGAFLRRTSIDELPQLFNVVAGTMSLVGPRPHATAHNEQYRQLVPGYMLRHKILPGITGLAQVNGCRGETDTLDKMERRVEFDHRYIRQWSLWLDLRILFETVFVVFGSKNAY